jgi:hypothetical protein
VASRSLRGSIKLQKLKDLLRCFRKNVELAFSWRCSRKNVELAFSSIFFLELEVFDNVELEWSCKNRNGTVPNTP